MRQCVAAVVNRCCRVLQQLGTVLQSRCSVLLLTWPHTWRHDTAQGILNGVEDVVRPDNAVLGLTETYDADSLDKKRQVKAAMQTSLGLALEPHTPLFLFMGRLDGQKGCDILFEAIGQVCTRRWNLCVSCC